MPPPGSGAQYYKNFYSIVLMAPVNANCEFTYVVVGKNGTISDGRDLENASFYQQLIKGY
jgi:hypothetical protein